MKKITSEQLIIFSDLDGTLLDHDSYSFNTAIPALNLIKLRNIPLVICTSKTRTEIEYFRDKLSNSDPFISENGGAISIPVDYFPLDFKYGKKEETYKIIELGAEYNSLLQALKTVSNNTGIHIKGFSQMSVNEISELTGMSEYFAELSKNRYYDEPFLLCRNNKDIEKIKIAINNIGFNYTEGGRFHHITGDNDKGKAVKILARLYNRKYSDIKTIGLGDSLNDLSMLRAVDLPILVKKHNNTYDARINLPNLVYSEGIGPKGWNTEIIKIINSL